ncbi:MAG: signal peptidase II [Candidatus Latescibacteria bacterium]|nr:signal peptidase II [Candidatus Latescibacterota bacterium]
MIILLVTTLSIIVLDQITKSLVSRNLVMHQPVNIIGSYLRFFLVHNQGLIWGLPFKSNLTYYVLPILGIVVVLYIALRSNRRYLGFVYGLILAGAAGNLIDRIRFGYVVDFIDMGIKNLRWPTYNIADMSIVFGVILILGYEILRKKNPHA